ncbi:MAG: PBP1A family penicillin-binding protein [Actinomycetota bacterium]|nr:PBP1A family penicillin-binding protein [Actinomycetota bacterium]
MLVSSRLATILKVTAVGLGTLFVLLLACGAYLYRLSATLPELDVTNRTLQAARTSIVYAADGSVLAEWHGEEDRTVVSFDQIPEDLRHAVVAIEDERFYSHNGVDGQAVMRAFRANAEEGAITQGGSTITQQLVKIMFTDGERTLTRKIREALLAYQLEARADKDEVLQTYLNTVYFGHGEYGVESAAQRFFGTNVSELTLPQCAMLAGVIRSPGQYSPIDEPDDAFERRNLVLAKMEDRGFIDTAEELEASQAPLVVAPPKDVPDLAPYFVEYVKQELLRELGADAVFKGGLRVQTSLEPAVQRQADKVAAANLGAPGDPECALVAIEHGSGRVIAMVGGRDFKTNQFNLASQGRRQPGSAFKTFVLVRALEEGIRPEQVFDASPYSVQVKDGTWNVQNYENQVTKGRLSLRAATNWSVNAVFARLIMKVGPQDVVDTAHKMGITSPIEANPAIALGGLTQGVTPLEMASAYGTLATGGNRIPPSGIMQVTNDRDETVYEPPRESTPALSRSTAVEASLMLHDVVENGTGVDSRIPGVWSAGKTGTTQSYRDAWFVGYAEDVSCAVWVGYREGQIDMTNVHGIKVTGGSIPAKIWREFMAVALKHQRSAVTPPPTKSSEGSPKTGIPVRVCPDSMKLANKRCPDPIEMYLDPQLVPKAACDRH